MDDGRIREASWTGSESARKEQGLCLPPCREPNKTPRFVVPAGTKCQVSKVSPLRWSAHITRRELGFERYEKSGGGTVTFREQGYLVRVPWSAVRRRV